MLKKLLTISFVLLVSFFLIFIIFRYFILEPVVMAKDSNEAPGNIINLKKGFTHYQVYDNPSVEKLTVLIHGGGVAGDFVWHKNIQSLSEVSDIMSYDLYDRGYSERINEKSSLPIFTNQLIELIDSLQLKKPFNVVALSMGSMIAIDYASRFPENVDKMVLVSPAVFGSFKKRTVLEIPVLSDLLMAFYWSPRAVENQKEEFFAPEKYPEYFAKLTEMKRFRGYIDSNLSTWCNILTISMKETMSELKVEDQQIMVIAGENDPFSPPDIIFELKSIFPDLNHQVIKQAGHMPQYEQSEIVNQLIITHLH